MGSFSKNNCMKKGFRTRAEALASRAAIFQRTEAQKSVDYEEYALFFPKWRTELDELFLGPTGFWVERIVSCPAWRSDRILEEKPWCRAMAIVVHTDEEGSLIHCPECLYFGERYEVYS